VRKIIFSQLTLEDLAGIIKLRDEGIDRALEELGRGHLASSPARRSDSARAKKRSSRVEVSRLSRSAEDWRRLHGLCSVAGDVRS